MGAFIVITTHGIFRRLLGRRRVDDINANPGAPVIIGGTGGSGTRIFAQTCISAGYFMGTNHNGALDALDYVDFYDRWVNAYLKRDETPLSNRNQRRMAHDFERRMRRHLVDIEPTQTRWGWKNPRSMLVLPFLAQQCSQMRFIHVVRDGRDMAYSGNQRQPRLHGVQVYVDQMQELTESEQSIVSWCRTNLDVAAFGQDHLASRYLRVRFEDICDRPADTIGTILEFIEAPGVDPSDLVGQVKRPDSIGRWQGHPDDEVRHLHELGREALEAFGYLNPT